MLTNRLEKIFCALLQEIMRYICAFLFMHTEGLFFRTANESRRQTESYAEIFRVSNEIDRCPVWHLFYHSIFLLRLSLAAALFHPRYAF